MVKRKIAIDVGHRSRGDEGAVADSGLSEHDYNAPLAKMIQGVLNEECFFDARIFRREDHGGIDGENRAIDAWGAWAVVFLHLNSAGNRAASGHEVLYFDGSRMGRELAASIDRELDKLPLRDRGIKVPPANGRVLVGGVRGYAVIIESAFLSSAGDVEWLVAEGNMRKLARCIADGIIKFWRCHELS